MGFRQRIIRFVQGLKRSWALALVLELSFFSGCSTYRGLLKEVDSVVGFDAQNFGEPARIEYSPKALRHPWMIRALGWFHFDAFTENVLGLKRQWITLKDPAGFLRNRIPRLVEEAESRLDYLGEASWRLLLITDKDPSDLNRSLAMGGLTKVLGILAPGFDPGDQRLLFGFPEEFERKAVPLLKKMETYWPGLRKESLQGEKRDEFATLLRDLTYLPAGNLFQERGRIRLLLEALAQETDPGLQHLVAGYLFESLRRGCLHGLVLGLSDRLSPEVRVTAVNSFYSLGRTKALPWILAQLKQNMAAVFGPTGPVDSSPDVRRRLAVLCASISPSEGDLEYGKGPSPFAFMYQLAFEDEDRGLRLFAREIFSWILHRPMDKEGAWIPKWWREHTARGVNQ
jgi:hypothetical protein